MIALTSIEQECRLGPLRKVLPKRRYTSGTRPGITGADPLGRDSASQDQLEFPDFPAIRKGLTRLEKKLIIAQVIQKAVLAIFKNPHIWVCQHLLPPEERGANRPPLDLLYSQTGHDVVGQEVY